MSRVPVTCTCHVYLSRVPVTCTCNDVVSVTLATLRHVIQYKPLIGSSDDVMGHYIRGYRQVTVTLKDIEIRQKSTLNKTCLYIGYQLGELALPVQ